MSQAKIEKADRLRASAAQIRQLYQELCTRPLEERRKIVGIGPKRAEIIVAGTAVLSRFLQDLQLPSLYYCTAGLRDGIIADLEQRGVGRELSQLDRDQRQVVENLLGRPVSEYESVSTKSNRPGAILPPQMSPEQGQETLEKLKQYCQS